MAACSLRLSKDGSRGGGAAASENDPEGHFVFTESIELESQGA